MLSANIYNSVHKPNRINGSQILHRFLSYTRKLFVFYIFKYPFRKTNFINKNLEHASLIIIYVFDHVCVMCVNGVQDLRTRCGGKKLRCNIIVKMTVRKKNDFCQVNGYWYTRPVYLSPSATAVGCQLNPRRPRARASQKRPRRM